MRYRTSFAEFIWLGMKYLGFWFRTLAVWVLLCKGGTQECLPGTILIITMVKLRGSCIMEQPGECVCNQQVSWEATTWWQWVPIPWPGKETLSIHGYVRINTLLNSLHDRTRQTPSLHTVHRSIYRSVCMWFCIHKWQELYLFHLVSRGSGGEERRAKNPSFQDSHTYGRRVAHV